MSKIKILTLWKSTVYYCLNLHQKFVTTNSWASQNLIPKWKIYYNKHFKTIFVNIYIFSFNIFIFCMVFTTCVDIGSDSIFWSSKTIYLLTTRRRLSVISFRFIPFATSATLQSKWNNLSRGVVGHFQYCHVITRNLSINSNSQKKTEIICIEIYIKNTVDIHTLATLRARIPAVAMISTMLSPYIMPHTFWYWIFGP